MDENKNRGKENGEKNRAMVLLAAAILNLISSLINLVRTLM